MFCRRSGHCARNSRRSIATRSLYWLRPAERIKAQVRVGEAVTNSMPTAAPTTNNRRTRRPQAPALRFDQRLVLNQWILNLFEVDSFIPLTEGLQDTTLEGV